MADMVWLASDEDRERKLAWHLQQALQIPTEKANASSFTKSQNAILDAMNPRDIDANLVMAQQARRVLDRLVI